MKQPQSDSRCSQLNESKTSRILFTCNSKISAKEVTFFISLHGKLRESGIEFVFLSPFEYPGMEAFLLRRPGWGQIRNCYNFPTLPTMEAMQFIDVDKWLLRVGYFKGHPSGHKDCLPILEQIAGEALALLERLEPGALVAWNSLYPVPGVMYDIAKRLGIPVIDSERGMLPGTLQLDPELRGLHNSLSHVKWEDIEQQGCGSSWAQAGAEFLESAYESDFCRYPVESDSVLEFLQKDRRAPLQPKVLVAGAFDSACGISLADPAREEILPGFESGFDLAKAVAQSHGGITIFKPHPEMVNRLGSFDTRGVRNLLVGSGHPRAYLEWADVVVTYGSLEYDALAFEKPVVLAGHSSLFGKGICYEALSKENLKNSILQACNREQFEAKRRRFNCLTGYLIEHRLFRFDTDDEIEKNAIRWFEHLGGMTMKHSSKESLSSIKRGIELRPTVGENAFRFTQKIAPSAARRLLRIWHSIRN